VKWNGSEVEVEVVVVVLGVGGSMLERVTSFCINKSGCE
jgi:hypothetical protein